jgi:uncharacterized OsmC-like protein
MPMVRTEHSAEHAAEIRLPSGTAVPAVAPDAGEGGATYPSDLLAAAVLSSMLTAVSREAARQHLQPGQVSGEAEAQAETSPARIGALRISLHFGGHRLDESGKLMLEQAAMRCPVTRSLHPELAVQVRFRYE